MNNFTREDFLNYASVFNSANPKERNLAYEQIESLIKQNPVLFTRHCISILEDKSVKEATVRIILTLLIRALKNGPKDNSGQSIWLSLERELKDQLLASSFSVVLHPSALIKKQGADLISTIFCLDRLNEKFWPNIIDSISQNVQHKDQGVREAAIYSLSFICEYTQDKPELILVASEVESLLSGIFNSLQQYNELTLAAVDALKFSTDFVIQRMHTDKDLETADYVFNILMELLVKCKECPNQDSDNLIVGTITCLKDICEGFFTKLNNYKEIVFEKVLSSLSFNSKIVNTVFFFFQGIFEMEYVEQTNYTKDIYKSVQSATLEFLLKYDQLHLDDEGGASLTQASFQLLKSINKLYIQQTLQDNLNFVYTNIEIQNVNNLCASIILFKSMIQHADKRIIEEPLLCGFQSFIKLLNHDHPAVVSHTLQLFAEVAQYLPDVLYVNRNNDQIIAVIESVLSKPEDFSQNDYQRAFEILIHLAEQVINNTKSITKNFRMKTKQLLDFVYDIAFKTDDKSVIDCCFTFFFAIIAAVDSANDLMNYFDNFRKMLKETAKNCSKNSEVDQQLICNIEIILNVIVSKLTRISDGPEKIRQNQEAFIELYQICKEQISFWRELLLEPYELMGSILLSSPDNKEFKAEVKNFTRTYVNESLKMTDQMPLYIKGVHIYLFIVDRFQYSDDSEIDIVLKQILDLMAKNYALSQEENFQGLQRVLVDYLNIQPKLIDGNFHQLCQHEKFLMTELICKKLKQLKSRDVEYINISAMQICELHQVMMHHIISNNHNYRNVEEFDKLMLIFMEFIVEYTNVIKNPGCDLASLMLGILGDYQLGRQEKNVVNTKTRRCDSTV